MHALADLAIGEPLADQLEDATLLVRERIEALVMLLALAQALHDALGGYGIQQGATSGHLADRVDEVVAADLLEDVARRSRHDRVEECLVVGVRREHETARLRHRVAHLAAHLDPTAVGQPHVEHGDIRPRRRDARKSLRGAARLAHDLEIILKPDEVG